MSLTLLTHQPTYTIAAHSPILSHTLSAALQVFELELKKQKGANEATRQETVAWVTKAQEIRSENSVWKRENIALRAEVQKLTKLRDVKQAEIVQTRQLEAEENSAASQLQDQLTSLRAQIASLEREKYTFRDQVLRNSLHCIHSGPVVLNF